MFCYNCGNKIVPNGKFCMDCGNPVQGQVPAAEQGSAGKTKKSTNGSKSRTSSGSRNKPVIFLVVFLVLIAAGTGSYFAYKHYHPTIESTTTDTYTESTPAAPDQVVADPGTVTAETNTEVYDPESGEGRGVSGWIEQKKYQLQLYSRLYAAFLIYLIPAFFGLILALGNFEWANTLTEKFEQWIRYHYENTANSERKFVRFALRPMLALLVMFSNWTDAFSHRGWKNGLRVALFLYVIIFWVMAVVYGAIVVISVIVFGFIMFFILRQFSPGTLDFFQKLVDAWKRGAEIGRGKR